MNRRGEETGLARLTLISRLLLQYHLLYVAPSVAKLARVDGALRQVRSRPLALDCDDAISPTSARWRAYREICTSIRSRLDSYVRAKGTGQKPFVILVVGRPGTGKSQFIKSVVEKALTPAGGTPVEAVELNLSQTNSVTGDLGIVWQTLHDRTRAGVGLLVLDEFDSQVGAETDQYRRVLGPLWDGQTQVTKEEGFGRLDLGSFVAVCIMSKVETASEARRFLLAAEKGADFLSRTDIIVEVPHIDEPETQLELALASLWHNFKKQEVTPNRPAQIGEVALRCLAWLPTTDNFRSLTKAIKTIPKNDGALRYDSLNLDGATRREFARAFGEFGRLDADVVGKLLAGSYDEPMLTVEIDGGAASPALTTSPPALFADLIR